VISTSDLLEAIAPREWADSQTLSRGRAYANAGRVVEFSVDRNLADEDGGGPLVVTGTVIGTRAYAVEITGSLTGGYLDVAGDCTCPVGWFCKHVAAALLVAADDEPTRSSVNWRRSLDAVLAEAPAPARPDPVEVTAVALQVVLPHAQRVFGYAPNKPISHPRLSVRPVRMGASGRWVKSGLGWRDLAGVSYDRRVRYDHPDSIEVLLQLQMALQSGRSYWSNANDVMDLHVAGANLWPLLRRAEAIGMPLLCSDPARTVTLVPDAAHLELDLRAIDQQVSLQPGAALAGSWLPSGDVSFVGDPAHGIVGWDDGQILLAQLDRRPTAAVRGWFARGEPVRVPTEGVADLLTDYLPRMRTSVGVGSRDGSVRLPEPPTILLRAELTWEADGSARLRWSWRYGFGPDGPWREYPVDDPFVGGSARDVPAEAALLDTAGWSEPLRLFAGVGDLGLGTLRSEQLVRGRDAMEFAEHQLPELVDSPSIDLVVTGEQPDFREATGIPKVRFTSSDDAHREGRTDWLELEIVVSIDDDVLGTMQIGLADVLTAFTTGQTTIMIGRGVFVDLDRPELDRLAQLVTDAGELTEQPADRLLLSRHQHDLLSSVAEVGPTDGQVQSWVRAANALRDLDTLPAPPQPEGLVATLRPYQREGFHWLSFLHEHGLGGVLADDMGLGKTLQALAMITRAREAARLQAQNSGATLAPPFLVIAPASVVGTWVSEARKFAPDLKVTAVIGSYARRGWPLTMVNDPDFPSDIVVTTYTLLRLEADAYAGQPWSGLLLDEAQSVKNHLSKTYAAARAIDAGSRFAITGTPMENNLMELWSVLSLAAPGLFPFAARFKERFAKPIEQGQDPGTLASLRRRIRPVMLRRTKELVAADLPPKQQQVLDVELSPRHRRIYDTHLQRERQRILKLLDDLDENRITILASLTKLRQLSLDPGLVDKQYDTIGSAKIDTLLDHLTELASEGHRALVFSQFTGFLGRIRSRLDEAGIGYSYLDGSTRKRAEVIDGFKNGTDPAFLISLKAGGVGLTLTEADYCFLLDPWWNPAVEAQAVDRSHRIGQTRKVVVYRLVSAGTIEQKVMELAQRKAALFSSVLDADSMMSSALTAADIAGLLGGVDDPMSGDFEDRPS